MFHVSNIDKETDKKEGINKLAQGPLMEEDHLCVSIFMYECLYPDGEMTLKRRPHPEI